MRFFAPVAFALALALAAVAWPLGARAQQAPVPAAEPAPVSTPSARPAPPIAAPLATPAATPAAPTPPAAAPTPTATPHGSPYHYIVMPPAPPAGQPAVLEIDLFDSTIHAGAPYSVRVRTSPDVTAINVSAMGSTYGMQAAGPGLFASDGTVPDGIPFFLLSRSYTVTITAIAAGGRTTTIPLTLRLER
jgi:hypothetical protein